MVRGEGEVTRPGAGSIGVPPRLDRPWEMGLENTTMTQAILCSKSRRPLARLVEAAVCSTGLLCAPEAGA